MTLLELAGACERADGADREIDLAIHLALDPDGEVAMRIEFGVPGLTGEPGLRYELSHGAFLFEQRGENGQCWASGGTPIAKYTASLDAAMSLVPKRRKWFLKADATGSQPLLYTSEICKRETGLEKPFFSYPCVNPALALAAAALRARHAMAMEKK